MIVVKQEQNTQKKIDSPPPPHTHTKRVLRAFVVNIATTGEYTAKLTKKRAILWKWGRGGEGVGGPTTELEFNLYS